MLFRPLSHPLNWYPYDVTGSLELLDVYVKDVERQVQKGIEDFERGAEEVVVEGTHPDEPPRFITIHQGIEDESWDLRAVFREYFPGLQRRSALITLFSFFEHELDKLCTLFQLTEKYKLSFRDVAGNGIQRARTYLLKVASLEIEEPAAPWREVKNIQLLRNLLVHVDGRLPERGSNERIEVRRYVDASELLAGESEVTIREGYLKHVLAAFDGYFVQVHAAIRRRYDA